MHSIFQARHCQRLAAVVSTALWCTQSLAQTNWTGTTGPTVGQIATNASASVSGIQLLLEAFLYCLGIFLFIKFILNARSYAKNSNNNGGGSPSDYVRNFMTQFVLSAVCFAAPTMMGGMRATIFGTSAVTSVPAPTASFSGQ